MFVKFPEYAYSNPIYSSYDNDGRLTGGLINLLGSPLPWLYAYGTYVIIFTIFIFFIAIFKQENTEPIIKKLFKKLSIVSTLLVATYFLSITTDAGNPKLVIGGIFAVFFSFLCLTLLHLIYKYKKSIWHFFANN